MSLSKTGNKQTSWKKEIFLLDEESVKLISSHLSRRCLKVKRLNATKSATLDEFVFDKIKTENKQQGLTLADQISRQK